MRDIEEVRVRHRSSSRKRDPHWYSMRDDPVVSDSWSHSPNFAPYSTLSRDANSDDAVTKGPNPGLLQQLKGDYANVALLVGLYVLQGIPLGLTSSIPLMLQGRHVSYKDQAVFSFAYWPFSLKLLWAPLVDSIYFDRLGRRKSWLIPTQYLIAVSMYILSENVPYVMGDNSPNSQPNVHFLTSLFFAFNFLAATQDIAVDGWALTMLSAKNVGLASTCNAVGQTAGWFIGNVVFLVLESKEFCNRYVFATPQSRGLVTLSEFVYFWALVFAVSTTLVLLFKKERDVVAENDEEDFGIKGTYKLMWRIVQLKPVISLLVIFMTCKVGFAAVDGISGLKMVEKGVPKDRLAFLAVPLVPLQIILPWVIGKYTSGPKPMNVWLKAYPYRLLIGLLFPLVIYHMHSFRLADQTYPISFYAIIVGIYCIHQITVYCCFVASMAFSAQVSDPRVGGTYMTLLNTVANLGGNWPVTVLMSCMDWITWKDCLDGGGESKGTCVSDKDCHVPGTKCETTTDGYFMLCIVTTILGMFWFLFARGRIRKLQATDKSDWTVTTSRI